MGSFFRMCFDGVQKPRSKKFSNYIHQAEYLVDDDGKLYEAPNTDVMSGEFQKLGIN